MNPTEPDSRPPFALAMKRLANAEPIVLDRGHTIDEKRIADYQRLLGDAEIPLARSDVNRYVQLLERYNPVGLASRPDLCENESIGVAALADLHRAPGARLIPQNDRETLQNDIEWRSGTGGPKLRFAAPPGPTLLRVARGNEPEIAVSHSFAARGTIVSVDDSHVVMQAHDATYRFRTADVAAAVDIGRIATAKERALPVHIRRADARVTVEVEQLQRDHNPTPAPSVPAKRVWRITDDLPLPPARLLDGAKLRERPAQPGAAPTLDDVLATVNNRERTAEKTSAAVEKGPVAEPRRREPMARAKQRDASNGVSEKTNASNSDRLVLRGRFVKVQQAEPGKAVGLVLKDDKNRLVQLSKEHTAALLEDRRANEIIKQNLQSGAQAPNVNLSYFAGKWSVSQAPQVYKPRR